MNEFAEYALNVAKRIQADADEVSKPPLEGRKSKTDQVIGSSLVRGTRRGYIEKVVQQINGTYENGWYDACAVMLRRLIGILIHEVFESHGIACKIKDNNNNLLHLDKLIDKIHNEPTWDLDEDSKKTLHALREIGNWSAHKRRYYTHRSDIEKLLPNIRVTVQELIYLAGLK